MLPLLLTVSLFAAAPASPPAEALALGIYVNGEGLQTFLVDPQGGVKPLGEGLHIPRKDGWWTLRDERLHRDESTADVLVSSPPGPPLPVSPLTPCAAQTRNLVLAYAGPEWVSFSVSGFRACGKDGARTELDAVGTLALWKGEMKEDAPRFVPLERVFGPKARKALDTGYREALREFSQPREDGSALRPPECLGKPTPTDWMLERIEGRWRALAFFRHTARTCDEHERASLRLDLPLPASVAAPEPLPKTWAEYEDAYPMLLDVLVSPSGARTVVLTQEEVIVLIGEREVTRHRVPQHAAARMAQWASGPDAVKRWLNGLQHRPAKAQGGGR